MLVNCVDLGDPPAPSGVPTPLSYVGRGISNAGVVAGAIQHTYAHDHVSETRTVAMCLFTPGENYSFYSPFGFTLLWMPNEAVASDTKVIFSALDPKTGLFVPCIGDSRTGSVSLLPTITGDHMLSGFTLAFARGDAYYGHYGASRTDPQGSAVIRGDTVQKIHVANLDPVWLTAISSDCQVAAYQYGTPAPNNAAIVSHGHTKTIEHAIVGSVNNAGNAVYFDNRTINQITFLKGNTATPIDIGALLGRAVEFGGSYYLNNNDVIAGTYREGDKSGAFILVNGHAHDLMTSAVHRAV